MQIYERPDHHALASAPTDAPDAMANLQCGVILGLLMALPTAAWVQHVYACVVSGSWGFLIGGTLFLPAGLVHGVGCWLGLWG